MTPRHTVLLFTDTLGDVNGVSRFIRNVADQALQTGRDLRVVTSTTFEIPDRENLVNFPPLAAGKMPRYENLEFAIPPIDRMMAYARSARACAVHISTPGPVGLAGLLAARRLGVPLIGTYHTDFPAYVERLFDDRAFTWLTAGYMRAFYRRFSAVFTRSHEYAASLHRLGLAPACIHRLKPGIETGAFQPAFRDETVWERLGVSRDAVKVLYCGRVSVEKNLPFLARVWKRVKQRGAEGACLLVVGDGPYRERMEGELVGTQTHFLGFRHGSELSAIYASSDFFVFPSTTDTLGQVVMESQSSGLPVLVTDQGGPKEVVVDGSTGFVLPAEEPEAWVQAIIRLARDSELRHRMSRAAHSLIQPQTIRASFDDFWRVHEDVAGRQNGLHRPTAAR